MKDRNQNTRFTFLAALAVILMLLLTSQGVLFAGDNEIEFKGKITQIDHTSTTTAKLTVALSVPVAGGPQVAVLVDSQTDITRRGDVTLTLADLNVGQFIEVRGVFTSTGIDARRIEVESEPESVNEFHIRGTLDGVAQSNGSLTLTVGGVAVVANTSTRIRTRGPARLLALVDLAAGQRVDIEGIIENGQLIATDIEIGPKMQELAELEFRGTVTAINGNAISIRIALQPPIEVVVNRTETTRIEGTLSVGVEVEVKATLARDFTIIALKIEVEGAAEAEHHGGNNNPGENGGGNPPQNVEREIQLTPPAAAPTQAEGEAEIEHETEAGSVQQKFRAKGEKLTANAAFSVQISFGSGFVNLGSFTTDNRGRGEFELSCGAFCPGFPTGKDVRNIVEVQILNGANAVVLQGTF